MRSLLKKIATIGDVLFILWVVLNAIDSGLRGTKPEVALSIGLVALLSLNLALIAAKM